MTRNPLVALNDEQVRESIERLLAKKNFDNRPFAGQQRLRNGVVPPKPTTLMISAELSFFGAFS